MSKKYDIIRQMKAEGFILENLNIHENPFETKLQELWRRLYAGEVEKEILLDLLEILIEREQKP